MSGEVDYGRLRAVDVSQCHALLLTLDPGWSEQESKRICSTELQIFHISPHVLGLKATARQSRLYLAGKVTTLEKIVISFLSMKIFEITCFANAM